MKGINLNSLLAQVFRTQESKQKEDTSESSSKKTLGDYGYWVTVQPYDLPIAVFKDLDEFQEFHKILTGEEYARMAYAAGLTITMESEDLGAVFVLYLPKRWTMDVVYHEALHMTHALMQFVGQDVDGSDSSSETQAYLQEHIVRRIRDEVYPRKKRVKEGEH